MNVDKIMRLVALASSPNEHEARTAAWMACKAIREGGLVLVPVESARQRPPPPPPRPEPPPRPNYADAKAKATARKLIVLQFKGWCRTCRQDIPAGAEAWWAKGDGCVCTRCQP